MAKKVTLEDIGKLISVQGKQLGELSDSLEFVIERMATKDDVRNIVKEVTRPQFNDLGERIEAVESKIVGTNKRLDLEAMQRTDLKLPKRVHELELKVFKASKHPEGSPR